MEQKLFKRSFHPDIADSIAMVYFNNITEYMPVKGTHIIKIDVGGMGVCDIDVLQSYNIHGYEEALIFASVLYSGSKEEIREFVLKQAHILNDIIAHAAKRMQHSIDALHNAGEHTNFVLHKILDTNKKNITILEIFELE